MKNFFRSAFVKTLAHAFVSTSVVGAATTVMSGAPLTSGTVLLPSVAAGVLAAVHAALPSSLTTPTPGLSDEPRQSGSSNFPTTR